MSTRQIPSQWTTLPPTEWQAKGVLGAGAYAIVGLWEYIGNNPNTPPFVVVKQQSKSHYTLKFESKLLSDIQQSCDTEHIVKLLKPCYREGGSGTSTADPHPFRDDGQYDPRLQVAKMYLEYCERGELGRKVQNCVYRHPVEHIWRILDCMARGLAVLEHGTEDPTGSSRTLPIAHFDIKPPNSM